jgi:hypothetical protein
MNVWRSRSTVVSTRCLCLTLLRQQALGHGVGARISLQIVPGANVASWAAAQRWADPEEERRR